MNNVYLKRKRSTREIRGNGYLEYIFKDYSESKKIDLKLVKACNIKIAGEPAPPQQGTS